jgi:octaprenyl-diphosphate synthase
VEDEVLGRLRDLCDIGGLPDLAATIDDLVGFVRDDLAAVEEGLAALSTGDTLVGEAGASLVHLGGKRLRPLCVVLASRVGSARASGVRDIAVAAELVHNATLLHDDVVDHADRRRGRPTARVELGNAASIFAGDYLLIEALNRVQRAAVPGVMEGLLETIAEMIRAESLQLENRGSLDASEDLYFEVARGKSAALFSWALGAGALSGGASPELCRALGAYGESIGVAFQLIDDLLDLVGHHSNTGKNLFSDLSEGKITYPLIVVLDREPALAETIRAIAAEATPAWGADGLGVGYSGANGDGAANGHPGGANGAGRERERVLEAMVRHDVEATCRDLAASYMDQGIEALAKVPDGAARRALTVVARASVLRER